MPKGIKNTNPVCSVDGCESAFLARGLCSLHYQRLMRHGTTKPTRLTRAPECVMADCGQPHYSLGYCLTHYGRLKSHGSPEWLPPKRTRKPVVLRRKKSMEIGGYVAVYEPSHPLAMASGYVREHRKVVYDAGIPVGPEDHVHHINGIKDDNRLENLEVKTPSDHHREHIREAGVVENQYGTFPVVADDAERAERDRVKQRAYKARLKAASGVACVICGANCLPWSQTCSWEHARDLRWGRTPEVTP